MARDINGIYTLPVGNPVVPDTEIASTWANPTMQDIANALTDSLSRTGQGGMQVPFKNADGTLVAPGDSWMNEPTAGWYRKNPHEFWFAVQGVDVFGVSPDGVHLGAGLAADFVHTVDTQWGIGAGTGDAVTVATSPPNTLLVDGMMIGVRNVAPNTLVNPTLNVDGLGAFQITRKGGQPLQAGDTGPANTENLFRYNDIFHRWELMTPQAPTVTIPTQTILASTSTPYFAPAGMKYCLVECIGGGGGGAGGAAGNGGGGGGAGGFAKRWLYAQQLAGGVSYLIGGGSTGNGGNTSFGSFLTATGGGVGGAGGTGGVGGAGSGSLVDVITGGNGHTGNITCGGNGGDSYYGSGGRGKNGANIGENGFGYGAGGGGAGPSEGNFSSGYAGVIKITEFYQ
jgi:hypothetical protein